MFDIICNAALQARDLAHLKSLLNDEYLDVIQRKPPQFTPGGYLASIGKHDAVELLRQLGANIDGVAFGYAVAGDSIHTNQYKQKYNALEHRILEGFAFAGHEELIPPLNTLNIKSINAIARGRAMANNREKVEELLKRYHASPNIFVPGFVLGGNHLIVDEWIGRYNLDFEFIAGAYAFIDLHDYVEFYRTVYKASTAVITRHYARASNHAKVEEFRRDHNVDLYEILYAYISVGNHSRVLYYQNHLGADVNRIAELYAFVGNHQKVEEYRTKYSANVDFIAFGYARAKDHAKVEEYRDKHKANPTQIALGYVKSECHDLVDSYFLNYDADAKEIAAFYDEFYPNKNLIPKFYRILIKLAEYDDSESELFNTLVQLRKTPNNYFNYFTIDNNTRLNNIMDAIEKLSTTIKLSDALEDTNSMLYKALHVSVYSGLFALMSSSSNQNGTSLVPDDSKKKI